MNMTSDSKKSREITKETEIHKRGHERDNTIQKPVGKGDQKQYDGTRAVVDGEQASHQADEDLQRLWGRCTMNGYMGMNEEL